MTEKKWYENVELIEKLKKEFEKAGLPLEYKAKKIFEEKGFEAFSSHYKVPIDNVLDSSLVEKEGTWRQIDISATPNDSLASSLDLEYSFGKFRLILTINFICECKFSSDKKFFLFKSTSDNILNFPLSIWGDNLLKYVNLTYNPGQDFNFNIYENIVEVNISKYTTKNENYNDRITHQACEQLFYAVNYDSLSAKYEIKEELREQIFQTKLFKKWLKFLSVSKIKKVEAIDWKDLLYDSISSKFLKENFELGDLDGIDSHMIFLQFPILIVNEETLFEVELDGKNNIIGFKKVKHGIYNNYVFEKSKKPYVIFYPENIGVIICDISYLTEVIDIVLEGFNKLGSRLKRIIDEKPYLLGYELLFNSDLIDPKEYFDHV